MIRHGHYLGYVNDRCRCGRCRNAWRLYEAKSAIRRSRGSTRHVDAARAVTHAKQVAADLGATPTAVLVAFGVASASAYRLIDGDHSRLDRDVERQVMASTVDDLPDTLRVDRSEAVKLRDEIMERDGLSRNALAEQLGLSPGGLAFKGEKVRLGVLRVLQQRSESGVYRGTCETCGGRSLAGGRWCYGCFTARTDKSVRSLVERDRRAAQAARRRRYGRSAA